MRHIDSISAVADRYDLIVFDQFGVLHDGSAPYTTAVNAISALQVRRPQLAVLSNSGKSGALNRERIAHMGFPAEAFCVVMTSGEALRLDILHGPLGALRVVYAMTASPADAAAWGQGLSLTFTDDLEQAEAVVLMGIPDAEDHPAERALLDQARALGKPLICSNPDRMAPRADGRLVESPGALAHAYADAGGEVLFYGKPYPPVFEALLAQVAPRPMRVLMVGDSPEHDIAGGKAAGWDTLFIAGGIHAGKDPATLFPPDDAPDFLLSTLR